MVPTPTRREKGVADIIVSMLRHGGPVLAVVIALAPMLSGSTLVVVTHDCVRPLATVHQVETAIRAVVAGADEHPPRGIEPALKVALHMLTPHQYGHLLRRETGRT